MELMIQKSGSGEKDIINVADNVFSVEFNEPLIHQVLTSYLAGARSGTKAQKTRAEVYDRNGSARAIKNKSKFKTKSKTKRTHQR